MCVWCTLGHLTVLSLGSPCGSAAAASMLIAWRGEFDALELPSAGSLADRAGGGSLPRFETT
jgi:hypothetical protein